MFNEPNTRSSRTGSQHLTLLTSELMGSAPIVGLSHQQLSAGGGNPNKRYPDNFVKSRFRSKCMRFWLLDDAPMTGKPLGSVALG